MNDLFGCRRCPRLVDFRRAQQASYPAYHNRPVAAFGARRPGLLVVGLAPGLHGANATGRPFTGDSSGQLLFEVLHRFGFASAAVSRAAGDGVELYDCRITNAVKCLPPHNRPLAAEIESCRPYLRAEIDSLPRSSVLLALGGLAHRAIIGALALRQADHRFAHGASFALDGGRMLFDSYHPSRYNQNTGRLDADMLARVFTAIRGVLA